MSIESEILRIQIGIANTYAAVADMGGNVPQNPTVENLAESVRSIPASTGTDGNPIGTVISFMGKTAPEGYLPCEGGAYNVSDYPALAEHFRTQFGNVNYFGGNGSTTFAVPDMRNLFLRGYHGSTSALSDNIGIKQEGTQHVAMIMTTGDGMGNQSRAGALVYEKNRDSAVDAGQTKSRGVLTTVSDVNISKQGINHTYYTSRPVNMAVLYCIKAVSEIKLNGGLL